MECLHPVRVRRKRLPSENRPSLRSILRSAHNLRGPQPGPGPRARLCAGGAIAPGIGAGSVASASSRCSLGQMAARRVRAAATGPVEGKKRRSGGGLRRERIEPVLAGQMAARRGRAAATGPVKGKKTPGRGWPPPRRRPVRRSDQRHSAVYSTRTNWPAPGTASGAKFTEFVAKS